MAQGRDVLRERGKPGNGWGKRLGTRPEAQVLHSASRISAVCQGHSGIKLVENGLKATRRGLRRKPCPEP